MVIGYFATKLRESRSYLRPPRSRTKRPARIEFWRLKWPVRPHLASACWVGTFSNSSKEGALGPIESFGGDTSTIGPGANPATKPSTLRPPGRDPPSALPPNQSSLASRSGSLSPAITAPPNKRSRFRQSATLISPGDARKISIRFCAPLSSFSKEHMSWSLLRPRPTLTLVKFGMLLSRVIVGIVDIFVRAFILRRFDIKATCQLVSVESPRRVHIHTKPCLPEGILFRDLRPDLDVRPRAQFCTWARNDSSSMELVKPSFDRLYHGIQTLLCVFLNSRIRILRR